MYDIIGDIHGHAAELLELLARLGYELDGGVPAHPTRRIVFAGDFIDRGPEIRETLAIVRPMIERGAAVAVMGNHELNALSYHTADPSVPGEFLREHSHKNRLQHRETMRQVPSDELRDHLEWFRTLPFWLELDGLRVVHACWDRERIDVIALALDRLDGVTTPFLVEANRRGSALHDAIEDVVKGKEIPLPGGAVVPDKEGHPRSHMRTRWFESPRGRTYAEYALSPETGFPDDALPTDLLARARPYGAGEPPVFFGHYWLRAERPAPLAPNVACVDYSVARRGMLCAYRFDGERELTAERFVCVKARDR